MSGRYIEAVVSGNSITFMQSNSTTTDENGDEHVNQSALTGKVSIYFDGTNFYIDKPLKVYGDTAITALSLVGVTTAKIYYQKVNGVVYITGNGNWGAMTTNTTKIVGTLPAGFRPPVNWQSGMSSQGGSQQMACVINANGTVGVTSSATGSAYYGGFSTSYPAE